MDLSACRSRKSSSCTETAEVDLLKTLWKWSAKGSSERTNGLREFQRASAHCRALPDSRDMINAIFALSFTNWWGCNSKYREHWSKKPLQAAASPEKVAGLAMGHAEAEGKTGGGWRDSRSAWTSSVKGSGVRGFSASIASFNPCNNYVKIFRAGLLSRLDWEAYTGWIMQNFFIYINWKKTSNEEIRTAT